MKRKFYFTILLLMSWANVFAQINYTNPVIRGFYSDPSICRVGEDYYMVHSSMGYFPSVPVFHSKNLVNWTQIGHVLTRKEQVSLEKAGVTLGIFAPTIRYHKGVFYMITTNITDKGNFYVTATNPAKEWSDPIWIDVPGIDPSLFFDDDGKVYVTSTLNWGTDIKEGIYLTEIDISSGKTITKPKLIWEGTGGRYPEGPHIYKKDGYYYLMIAEGGTEFGHKETIARSKYLEGPYQGNPANPILTHINMNAETSPIQGVGHGDLVETQHGDWFMVAHAFQQYDGHQILGRETFLLPVKWEKKAWPVVNGDGTVSDHSVAEKLPAPIQKQVEENDKTDFNETSLGPVWNYLNNPTEQNYSLTDRKGYLRLKGSEATLNQLPNVTFVGRRQQHHEFQVVTKLDFNPSKNKEEAGLTVFKSTNYHYNISVKNNNGKRVICLTYHLGKIKHTEKEILIEKGEITLRITGSRETYQFEFSQSEKPFVILGEADTRFLSSVTAGGFTGCYIGLFATGNGQKSTSVADFDSYEYKVTNN